MNIITCVKAVIDPELPPAKFKIDSGANRVVPPEGMPPVISAYDANAMEAALKLKDSCGAKVTALGVGADPVAEALRHALAIGAEEAVMVVDKALQGIDSFGTAHILVRAIEKLGEYDLILCGRQAADSDAGQVGSLIAAALGLPLVTIARSIEVIDGKLKVETVLSDGYQVFEVPLPAVVTVGEEIGKPRLPKGMGIIKAARKEIPQWSAADIGADLSQVQRWAGHLKLQKLYLPVNERACEIIEGEKVSEMVANLAQKLRASGVI